MILCVHECALNSLSSLSDVMCNHAQTGRILGNVGNVEINGITKLYKVTK